MVANAVEGFTNLFSGKDRDGDGLKDGSFRNLKDKTKNYKYNTIHRRTDPDNYDTDPANNMYSYKDGKLSVRSIPIPKDVRGLDPEEYLKRSRKTLSDAGYGDLASLSKTSFAGDIADKAGDLKIGIDQTELDKQSAPEGTSLGYRDGKTVYKAPQDQGSF